MAVGTSTHILARLRLLLVIGSLLILGPPPRPPEGPQAEPVDRTCLFPGGWQYRLDPQDEGLDEAWFRPEPRGPWDEVPNDPGERRQKLKEWRGPMWLRAEVTVPAEWAGQAAFVGLSRARWYIDREIKRLKGMAADAQSGRNPDTAS